MRVQQCSRSRFVIFAFDQEPQFFEGFLVFTHCSVFLVCRKPPDLSKPSRTLFQLIKSKEMPSRTKRAVATNLHSARAAKTKARLTIKTVTAPKSKARPTRGPRPEPFYQPMPL